jgi:hypothetical protein
MSYTSTVERKRRRKFYRSSHDFKTVNEFRGQAVRGELSVNEWSHKDDIDIDVSVHADGESVVEAKFIKGSIRGFVTVDVATYHTDSEVLRNPEACLFLSVEQAVALRDSLNALDI